MRSSCLVVMVAMRTRRCWNCPLCQYDLLHLPLRNQ